MYTLFTYSLDKTDTSTGMLTLFTLVHSFYKTDKHDTLFTYYSDVIDTHDTLFTHSPDKHDTLFIHSPDKTDKHDTLFTHSLE